MACIHKVHLRGQQFNNFKHEDNVGMASLAAARNKENNKIKVL
jgi:hypothetical protein